MEILRILFGSYLYGTNTASSDKDYKAIYIPSSKEILLGNYSKTINKSRKKELGERNTNLDVDVEIFSLDQYLHLLMEGQTVSLDMLFAPEPFYVSKNDPDQIFKRIQDNRLKLISKQVQSFLGYAKQQAHRYGIKGTRFDVINRTVSLLEQFNRKDKLGIYESQINTFVSECSNLLSLEKSPLASIVNIKSPNEKLTPHLEVCGRKVSFTITVDLALQCFKRIQDGYGSRAKMASVADGIDWKALSHAVRVNSEAKELLSTGFITFPRPDNELLIEIKTGNKSYDEVAELIEMGLQEVVNLSQKSILPNIPDLTLVENIICDAYRKQIK